MSKYQELKAKGHIAVDTVDHGFAISAHLSDDCRFLAVPTNKNAVFVYDCETMNHLQPSLQPSAFTGSYVRAAKFSPQQNSSSGELFLAAGGYEGNCVIWKLNKNKENAEFEEYCVIDCQASAVNTIVWIKHPRSGKLHVACGTDSGHIVIAELPSTEQTAHLKPTHEIVISLASTTARVTAMEAGQVTKNSSQLHQDDHLIVCSSANERERKVTMWRVSDLFHDNNKIGYVDSHERKRVFDERAKMRRQQRDLMNVKEEKKEDPCEPDFPVERQDDIPESELEGTEPVFFFDIEAFTTHRGTASRCAWNHKTNNIAISVKTGTSLVFNADSKKKIFDFTHHAGKATKNEQTEEVVTYKESKDIEAVCFSSCGRYVLHGATDEFVEKVHNVRTTIDVSDIHTGKRMTEFATNLPKLPRTVWGLQSCARFSVATSGVQVLFFRSPRGPDEIFEDRKILCFLRFGKTKSEKMKELFEIYAIWYLASVYIC